jgi:hypothetical protein
MSSISSGYQLIENESGGQKEVIIGKFCTLKNTILYLEQGKGKMVIRPGLEEKPLKMDTYYEVSDKGEPIIILHSSYICRCL